MNAGTCGLCGVLVTCRDDGTTWPHERNDIVAILGERRGKMLMLIGEIYDGPVDPPLVVAIRFFSSRDGARRVLKLAKKQVRKRYSSIELKTVVWTVYEPRVAYAGKGPASGGFPEYLGAPEWYM
jgi:hypothetical protein